ncbi:hypothetical protein [Carnobacterium maltaromaticum]|uniref:hypothetical protein n=1 Tax=Carnobacterium maltaromaticum TaxID=2751 RepID=UPI0039AECCA7
MTELKMIDCEVKVLKEWKSAKLVGFYQCSYVKQSILIGEIGGVIAYPVALVYVDSHFQTVDANLVKLVNKE